MIDLTRPHGLEPGTVLVRGYRPSEIERIVEWHYCPKSTNGVTALFEGEKPCLSCGAKPPRREEAGSPVSHPELMPGAPAPSLWEPSTGQGVLTKEVFDKVNKQLLLDPGLPDNGKDLRAENAKFAENNAALSRMVQQKQGYIESLEAELGLRVQPKRLEIDLHYSNADIAGKPLIWTGMPEAAYEEHVCRDGRTVVRRGPDALKPCPDCNYQPLRPPARKVIAVDPAAKSVTVGSPPPGEWRCTCGSSFPDEGSEHHHPAERHHMEFFKNHEEFTERMLAQFAPAAPRGCRMERIPLTEPPWSFKWDLPTDPDIVKVTLHSQEPPGDATSKRWCDAHSTCNYTLPRSPRPGERFWLTFTDAAGRESGKRDVMVPVPLRTAEDRARQDAPFPPEPDFTAPTRCPACGEVTNHCPLGPHCRGKP